MKSYIKCSFLLLLLYSITTVGFTQPLTTISIRSDQLIAPYSNAAITQASLEWCDLNHTLYWATESALRKYSPLTAKLTRGFLTGLMLNHYHLDRLFSVSQFVFGQSSRARAFGYSVSYSTDLTGQVSDYYSFLIDIITHLDSFTYAYNHYTGRMSVDPSVDMSSFDIIYYTAGFNNSAYLSEKIAERFYIQQTRSVFDFLTYFLTKHTMSRHINAEKEYLTDVGSIKSIVTTYADNGIDVTYSQLKRYNGYAILLSSTFWAMLDGWSRYVMTGLDSMTMYEWGNWRLPDVTMYLTSHGLSYKVQSGYRFNLDHFLLVGIEHVFLGEHQQEYSVGWHKNWGLLSTVSNLRVGHAVGGSQQVTYFIKPNLSVTGGIDLMQQTNLYAERHTLSLKNSNQSIQVWFNLIYQLL